MSKQILYKNDRATVCAGNTCVTVYGDAARIISNIVIWALFLWAIAFIAKTVR